MAKVRRTVHKVEHGHIVTFDDQLWPINVALVVLAGFVAGTIVAIGNFEEPRLLFNGWTHLTLLAVGVAALMWTASHLSSRRFRRGIQLAGILSLLIHFVLMVFLYNQKLAYQVAHEDETLDVPVSQDIVTLPEYHLKAPEDVTPEAHEKPVETETPKETPTQEIEREEQKQIDKPVEPPPTPVPGKVPEVQPTTVQLKELEQATPRRAEETSKLSKQTAKVDARPQEAINEPTPATQPKQEQVKVDAQVSAVERRQTDAPQQQQKLDEPQPTTAAPQQQAVKVARREVTEPTPTQSSVPTLTRAVSKQPVEVPRAEAESPQSVAEAPTDKPAETQPVTAVARQQTDGPRVAMQQAAEPQPSAAPTVSKSEVARVDSPVPATIQPQVTTKAAPTPSRSPQSATPVAATATADPNQVAAAAAGDPSAPPAPTEAKVARAEAAAPVNNAAAASTAPAAPAAQPSPVAGAQIARAETGAVPTLNPSAAPGKTPSRAVQSAKVEASPVAADSPAVAQSTEASNSSSEPARTALAKGTAGVFGVGSEQNFDRGLSATLNPAPVASIAATRAQATQSGPQGPSLSPSAPAAIAKSIAGANLPSAALPAEDVNVPDAVGAAQPSNIEASSSAAVQRTASSAPRATVTGAVGSGQIDTGPTTQVVGVRGSSRAAGGGAPTVKLNTQGPQLARSSVGGAPLAALNAPAVAAAPQAPAGTGGGAPAAPAAPSGPTVAATKSKAGEVALPSGTASPSTTPAAGGGGATVGGASLARAEATGGPAPAATTGAAKAMPSRSIGRAIAADTRADAPELPAGPVTGDAPTEPGIAAAGGKTLRSASGLPGKATTEVTGAAAGPSAVDTPLVGVTGAGLSQKRGDSSSDPAPTVGQIASAGPMKRSTRVGLPTASAAAVEEPNLPAPKPAGGATAEPQPDHVAGGGDVGPLQRRSGSLPVHVAALSGPGGLGAAVSLDVGSLSRRAQRDSDIVHAGTARFLGRKVGGPLAIDGTAREPAEAYARRGGLRINKSTGPAMPSERTEAAIELGLDFLARHQSLDGSWSLTRFGAGRPGYEKETSIFQSDTAATGLSLLAFLGAGYDHFDDQYKNNVRGGLDFLLKIQKPDGDLYLPQDANSNQSAWLYSHAIATIALCEALGMTGDEALREPAQKAIDFIVKSQNPQQGGWRYTPQYDSDTSVSGWQLMALKSGELAGMKVPQATYDKIRKWLDQAQASSSDASQYVYNPKAPDTVTQRHGRRPSPPMTAVGLLMRMYLGWNRNDPQMVAGVEYLLENPPTMGTFIDRRRDTYYWYYATQVLFHMKGKYWQKWNEQLHPLLAEKQVRTGPMAGSWDPLAPVPDKWGEKAGRIYVTTMNLLSLEVFYRHLPIYESTAQ